jgi:hypothetical protein
MLERAQRAVRARLQMQPLSVRADAAYPGWDAGVIEAVVVAGVGCHRGPGIGSRSFGRIVAKAEPIE